MISAAGCPLLEAANNAIALRFFRLEVACQVHRNEIMQCVTDMAFLLRVQYFQVLQNVKRKEYVGLLLW